MNRVVVVIEDEKTLRSGLLKSLKNRLKKTEIKAIDGNKPPQDNKTYEAQLEEIFTEIASNGAFVITDKDLSDLGDQFRGLSGTIVAAVADTMGFPLCMYARGEGNKGGEEQLKSYAPWVKQRIIIEFKTENELAQQCADLFRGFSEIEKGYLGLKKEDRATPAAALSCILKQPEIEGRIALYGAGEQGLLQEIMPYREADNGNATQINLKERMPRILGNWLYTSILRFPGILVNKTAAASYLNISIKDFNRPEVQKLFVRTKYKGPFFKLSNWWWRHQLDNILFKNNCEDGLEYTKFKNIGVKVKPCYDPKTKKRAGYYCMVTKQPLSDENSKSNISWFPGGADLARIRLDKFNEIAPWIGLY